MTSRSDIARQGERKAELRPTSWSAPAPSIKEPSIRVHESLKAWGLPEEKHRRQLSLFHCTAIAALAWIRKAAPKALDCLTHSREHQWGRRGDSAALKLQAPAAPAQLCLGCVTGSADAEGRSGWRWPSRAHLLRQFRHPQNCLHTYQRSPFNQVQAGDCRTTVQVATWLASLLPSRSRRLGRSLPLQSRTEGWAA